MVELKWMRNAEGQAVRAFSLMGVAQDWLHPGLRRVGEASHSIYYLPTDDAVLVVRVLHERMDVTRMRMTLQSPAGEYRPEI
ncbi:type II toxin-antitoxin system RelE/ParE family toxin [Sphingomonas sp. BT-65]|uniref:type II toxin-antitoxin system RelE/ParE family toxin n=1 Tax=Sphingomonas sp. BT-65 TaxID=2989821 RepID=UPI00223548B7|nr:type II toxin-antitoxin system RelE/ParE family toxin [Sphingomonas sp. BT-65]MCW4461596.1 type II toxin-antitoxin system RelE/ParE family toxin [Sphingomonas sp. BT-65]